jgi:quinol monooxygenase YgiN
MHVLVVRGTVNAGQDKEFLAAARDYNAAREAAGVPAYRQLVRAHDGGEEYVFVAEFADEAEIDRVEQMIDAGDFAEPLEAMYRHLVAGSVSVLRLREV